MFKKTHLAVCLSFLSASSYAYVIENNFTVENKTDAPLIITVEQPNGQPPLTEKLPPHRPTTIQMNNGDASGLLFQTSVAPFTIQSDDSAATTYVKGRVAYYVGASVWKKYSFLNSVSSAKGVTTDLTYSCARDTSFLGNVPFNNKIVIDGKPGAALTAQDFPEKVSCKGVESSTMTSDFKLYDITCFDGNSAKFTQGNQWSWRGSFGSDHGTVFRYMNEKRTFDVSLSYLILDLQDELSPEDYFKIFKAAVDRDLGQRFCNSW